MQDVFEIRRSNLLLLIELYKTVAKLNEALGRKRYDGTLHQIKNRTKTPSSGKERTMGAEIARQIEVKLHLTPGWMDIRHDNEDSKHIKESESYLKSNFNKISMYKSSAEFTSTKLNLFFDGEMKLSEYFINSVLNPTSQENLRFLPILDSSLKSILNEGDALIIDIGIHSFQRDGLYLIRVGNQEVVRKITSDYEGGYVIWTDDFSQKVKDLSKIEIVAQGLYICSGKRI